MARRQRDITADDATVRVSAPQLRRGRLFCPRCGAALRFNGEDLFCVACGYEHEFSTEIARAVRAARRQRSAAAAVTVLLMLTGLLLGIAIARPATLTMIAGGPWLAALSPRRWRAGVEARAGGTRRASRGGMQSSRWRSAIIRPVCATGSAMRWISR